ncbi:MAG: hypothetical protein KJS67_02405 [Actinomycetales bacterium]|nr:hypothetical protein [Actinomycetales bacterium]
MSETYIPGACNLGKAEVRSRQFVALVGLVMSVTALVGLISNDASSAARWSIFAPLMIFSVGFLQSRKKFCLAYGFMGTFNLGKLGEMARVADPAFRKADRAMALKLLFQAAALAFLISALVVVLPL